MDILEISDDSSNDTIIVSYKDNENVQERIEGADLAVETELNVLLEKYLGDPCHSDENSEFQRNLTSSIEERPCHDSEDSDLPTFSHSKKKCVDAKSRACVGRNVIEEDAEMSAFEDEKHKKNPTSYLNREQKCEEKEYIRKQKLEQREFKKQEQQRNAALKEALLNHYKNLKPENCLKFIKIHIDVEITTKDFWQDVRSEFENAGISFTVEPQQAVSVISWTRKIDSYCLDENVQLIDISEDLIIEEVLLIIESNNLLIKIKEESFLSYIDTLYTTLKGKKIILAIYGLDKYFKSNKSRKRVEIFEEGTQTDSNYPVISRRAIEYVLTEIQLLYNIAYRMIETSKDIAFMVLQLTKSIAQIPYKLEKRKTFMQNKCFMAENNKNCIRIDKNGNGLSRLWKQIITTFPLASLETAEAICAVYPTPFCLIKEYENITDSMKAEKLLQDIPIRRTAGPIITMRKVGPEFSKKIYYLFSSLDPHEVL